MKKEKKKKKKVSSTKKHPDGFIAYQMHKAKNQIGDEYEGHISNVLIAETLG